MRPKTQTTGCGIIEHKKERIINNRLILMQKEPTRIITSAIKKLLGEFSDSESYFSRVTV